MYPERLYVFSMIHKTMLQTPRVIMDCFFKAVQCPFAFMSFDDSLTAVGIRLERATTQIEK